jgi:hypothetical protein
VTPIKSRQVIKAEPVVQTQPEPQQMSWDDFNNYCYRHGIPPERRVELAMLYNSWIVLPEEAKERMKGLILEALEGSAK